MCSVVGADQVSPTDIANATVTEPALSLSRQRDSGAANPPTSDPATDKIIFGLRAEVFLPFWLDFAPPLGARAMPARMWLENQEGKPGRVLTARTALNTELI